jgi:aminoglycoside phosphotransferase (APT) family kinase protein
MSQRGEAKPDGKRMEKNGFPPLAALSKALGIEIYTMEPEPIASGGAHSQIYACQTSDGERVLRIGQGRQGFYTHYFPERVRWQNWLDQHWAITHARQAGVPAPEIVASNRDLGAMLMKRLPGVPIDSRYDEVWQGCPYDEREFGRLLRRLHSIRPSGYGPIDDFGSALFTTWGAFLSAAAHSAIQTCRERGSLPNALCEALEQSWLPRLSNVEYDEPCLLHMESLGFANLLYDPATRAITGLLDYEDCLGGDPLFEFVWMSYYFEHDDPEQTHFDFARFRSSYGQFDYQASRTELYAPFPYLDKLRWIAIDGERAQSYWKRLARMLDPDRTATLS